MTSQLYVNLMTYCKERVEVYRNETNEGVSRSFRTGRLERELQMVQFSVTMCS